jgi:hypothetical protein
MENNTDKQAINAQAPLKKAWITPTIEIISDRAISVGSIYSFPEGVQTPGNYFGSS